MIAHEACVDEIERLHSFFVSWYAGELEESAFDQFEDALASEFEMITPDGDVMTRQTVIDAIAAARGSTASSAFQIDIRNVEVKYRFENHALVQYEEWQETDEDVTGRISTVVLTEMQSTPDGLGWSYVHETYLE